MSDFPAEFYPVMEQWVAEKWSGVINTIDHPMIAIIAHLDSGPPHIIVVFDQNNITRHSRVLRIAVKNLLLERYEEPFNVYLRRRDGIADPDPMTLPKLLDVDVSQQSREAFQYVFEQLSEGDEGPFHINIDSRSASFIADVLGVLSRLQIEPPQLHAVTFVENSIKRLPITPRLVRSIHVSIGKEYGELWDYMIEQVAQSMLSSQLEDEEVVEILMTSREYPDLDLALARRVMELIASIEPMVGANTREAAVRQVHDLWEAREDVAELEFEKRRAEEAKAREYYYLIAEEQGKEPFPLGPPLQHERKPFPLPSRNNRV